MNYYVERISTPAAKNQMALYPAPGLEAFSSYADGFGTGVGRALFAENGQCFAVLGRELVEIYSNGTNRFRSGVLLATDANPAQITTNGAGGGQLFFSCGDTGYLLDLEDPYAYAAAVVDDVTMVAFLEGFFIRFDTEASLIAVSAAFDGATWDPLQFQQRSGNSDPWRAMAVNGSDLWLVGEKTGEIWYNAGAFPFPLVPRGGITFSPGIAAPFSLVAVNGRMTWLAEGGDVVQAAGYNPTSIATPAVAAAIGSYTVLDDAVGMTYQYDGHYFYQLSFPTAGATWLYDQTLSMWTERGQWNGATGRFDAWGPQFHAHAFGHHLVADFRTATINRMAADLHYDTAGAPMRRLRIAPGICDERRRIFYDKFQLYVQTGVGLTSGQGVDPQMWLSWSDDAGETWTSPRFRSIGKKGQRGLEVSWNRCGSSKDRVFQLVSTDPVPTRIVDAFLTVRTGGR